MPDALRLPLTDPAFVFAALVLLALAGPILAERIRVPGIIGVIVLGMLAGPTGLGVLERAGVVELLGSVGLLYLMFLAGLDLDPDRFDEHSKPTILFSATTFVIPMVVNTLVARAFGLSWPAALLVASAFTSHTVLTYPLVRRFGLAQSTTVAVTLGATLAATVAALLVLAVVAAGERGDTGAVFWIGFVVGGSAFLVAALWGLPRLTRWFFRSFGQDRTVRFLFVVAAVFVTAAISDLARIESIVGAFIAGFALNRFVPNDSLLMERLQFLGNSLLIPLFLISTGMLIDPLLIVTDPRALALGLALTASALGAKLLAILPVSLYLRADRAETGVMFSLTSAQAAGALAAVLVAVDIGLVGEDVVNAVVLVILLTCVVAPAVGVRYAPLMRRPERRPPRLGESIVVPISNLDHAEEIMRLAGYLAAPDSGIVMPLTVLNFDASIDEVEEQQQLLTDKAEPAVLGAGADARTLVRIDVTSSAGMLHTVVENHATCLLMGWKGFATRRRSSFGEDVDAILTLSPVPVLVCRPGSGDPHERVVLSITERDLGAGGLPGLELSAFVASRLARQADLPLLVVTQRADPKLDLLLRGVRNVELVVDERRRQDSLTELTCSGDLVVFGIPPVRAGLGKGASRLAQTLPDRSLLVVAPR